MNLQLRMQALQQGRYVVAQQLNDAHLTIPELRENLRNEDESVPRKIISMATNFVNTDPYWREQKRKLDALTFFIERSMVTFQHILTPIVVQNTTGHHCMNYL